MYQAAGCTQGDQESNCLPTLKFIAVLVIIAQIGNKPSTHHMVNG